MTGTPSSRDKQLQTRLEAIDTLFSTAGLVRHRRGKPGGITRELRKQRSITREELFVKSPAPTVAPNGLRWLPVPAWQKLGWLWHGFSTRQGGVSTAYSPEDGAPELNLGFTAEDDRDAVLRNRGMLVEAITGDPSARLVTVRQFHSNIAACVAAEDFERTRPCRGDGLMTDQPGELLAIQTADCIPVLVADCRRRVVAAFHAGWRGTVKRIVELGVGKMRLQYGCRPEDLTAAIGPGIGACCYAVGDEVFSAFESQFAYASDLFVEVFDSDPVRKKYPMLFLTQRAPGHSPIGPALHLNLVEANRRQLLDAGIKAKAVHAVGGCTSCQPELFFSHRASQGHAGRMMSVIGVRPG